MGLKINSRVSQRYLRGAALIVVSGLFAGCSSDFTRFTDGIYTGSTPAQQAIVQNPVLQRQPMPSGGYGAGSVQSSELPPVPSPEPQQNASAGMMPSYPVTAAPSHIPGTPMAQRPQGETGGKTYIVQSGDTLTAIARKNGLDVQTLKQENGLNTDIIRVGQSLTIPGENKKQTTGSAAPILAASILRQVIPTAKPAVRTGIVNTAPDMGKTVKPNPPEIEKAVASSADAVQKVEQVAIVTPQATGIAHMRWPVQGRILSNFGQREGTATNDGMDIMVPEGTSVHAAENGVVIYADNGLKEFGNTILIRHEDNIVTVYGHNSKILVQRGQKVRRGDEIAKSGMSGNATTPRLHFEVRRNSLPVNPVKYLDN